MLKNINKYSIFAFKLEYNGAKIFALKNLTH